MAELHEALKLLSPVDWSDVPLDDLPTYLTSAFRAGELICNSVPPPPNGTVFESSAPHHTEPNGAKTAKEMHVSETRLYAAHEDHTGLQKGWGKPLKVSEASNPLKVMVHKMAGHDRHGAWFARTSVHEGMGFSKFKSAMQRELGESLAVEGGPGAGAIRGLSADRKLEDREVDSVGKLVAYQLSAQFPGPTTPRDFTTMLLVSEGALSEKSSTEIKAGEKYIPRNFMVVSRPVRHPDAPEQAGYVRGQYESVEMIREIPLHNMKSADGEEAGDPELNPIEWVMITRSDPGGGLPRFLVDRGTPDAMLGDVTKFLNWACGTDGFGNEQETTKNNPITPSPAAAASTSVLPREHDGAAEHARARSVTEPPKPQNNGMFSNLGNTVQAGLDAYAPAAVSSQVNRYLHPDLDGETPDVSDSSSDSSSLNSFMSAEEMRRKSTNPEAILSTDNLSLDSTTSDLIKGRERSQSQQDREVQKLVQQRERLDRKLAKKRVDEESRLKKSAAKEQSEQDKAKERHDREIKKTEERHRREIEKLEQKKQKEADKAEARRKKKDDNSKLSMVVRERDDYRSQVDMIKRENNLLMQQMEELQRENTAMAIRLGKLGGDDALRSVREDIDAGRKRAVSMRSGHSSDTTRSKDVK